MMVLGKPKLFTKFDVTSFSRCGNIKGEPPIVGSSPRPGLRPLFSACDFVMSLGKPQRHAKFEVASPSRCRNIKEEPPNFGELT